MAFVLSSAETSYRFDRNLLEKPGYFERFMVVVTSATLLMGLPIDWFRTRAQVDLQEGNLKMVAVQLALMMFAVMRVVGRLDDVIAAMKLEITIFMFTGLAMASLFWSADIGETIRQSIVLTAIAFYGLYLIIRFEMAEIVRLLSIMFVISAICSLIFVYVYPLYGLQPTGQWDGVFYHKNALGFASAIAMPALIVAGRTTPRLRLIFYAAVPAPAVLLLFSESKTMYVAGYGSIVLLMVYRFFRGRRTLRGAVMLSMSGSTLFAIAFATANIALLAKWLDKDVTLTGRVPLWEDLFSVAMERVVLGHGYRAAFGGYFSPVHEVWIQHTWQPSHAHNALFHLWLEVGIVGIILFLIGFFRAVKRAIHAVNLVPDAMGLWPITFLSTSLLISISESGITYAETGWLMYVVAVLGVSNWYKNQVILTDPDTLEKMQQAQELHMAENGLVPEDPSVGVELVGADVR